MESDFEQTNQYRALARAISPEEKDPLDIALARERIQKVLGTLSPEERTAVDLHFGLSGGEALNYTAIAKSMGVPFDTARKYYASGLHKLQHHTRRRWLLDFADPYPD